MIRHLCPAGERPEDFLMVVQPRWPASIRRAALFVIDSSISSGCSAGCPTGSGMTTSGCSPRARFRSSRLSRPVSTTTSCPSTEPLSVSRSLDLFDGREPGRYAVVVVSRLNPVRFDGGDVPSVAGAERRPQLFLVVDSVPLRRESHWLPNWLLKLNPQTLTPRHLCRRKYQRKFCIYLRSQVRAYTRKSASVRAGCHSDSHSGADPSPHRVGKHGGAEPGPDEGPRS